MDEDDDGGGMRPEVEGDATMTSGDDVETEDPRDVGDTTEGGPGKTPADPDDEPTATINRETTPTLYTQDEPLTDDQGRKVRVIYSDGDSVGEEKNPNNSSNGQHGRYKLRNRDTLRSALDRWERRRGRKGGGKIALDQVLMRKGLELFGEWGVEAVESEMKQLHEMGALEPVGKLSWKEKSGALGYLMYFKEKSDGKIKGRGCADGRKQRRYISMSEAASPTVSVEAFLITSVIDASEGRDVGVAGYQGHICMLTTMKIS